MSKQTQVIRKIDEYFDPWIRGLLRWEREITKRSAPVDLVALLCICLDSLGTKFFESLKKGNRDKFVFLLKNFTPWGEKWRLVSLPDLYAFLLWAKDWGHGLLESGIRFRGRQKALELFPTDMGAYDAVVDELLNLVHKLCCTNEQEIVPLKLGVQEFTKSSIINALMNKKYNAKQLLIYFSLGEIFYEDYRCKTVHELTLPEPILYSTTKEAHEQFWTGEEPYIATYKPDPLAFTVAELRGVVFPLRFIWAQVQQAVCNVKAAFLEYVLHEGRELTDELDIMSAQYLWSETLETMLDDGRPVER